MSGPKPKPGDVIVRCNGRRIAIVNERTLAGLWPMTGDPMQSSRWWRTDVGCPACKAAHHDFDEERLRHYVSEAKRHARVVNVEVSALAVS